MHVQVKKIDILTFKVDIFTTPRQNSLPGPYHKALGRVKLLVPPDKREDNENLFQNVLL